MAEGRCRDDLKACLSLTQEIRGNRQRGSAGLEAGHVPSCLGRVDIDDQEADTTVDEQGFGDHEDVTGKAICRLQYATRVFR